MSGDGESKLESTADLVLRALGGVSAGASGLPEWKLRTSEERQSLAKAASESPIEVRFAEALVSSRRFLWAASMPHLGDIKPGQICVLQQLPVGNYRLDIAVVLRTHTGVLRRVAIECDGRAYHSTPEQIERDLERDEWFVSMGWIVWRYTGATIHHEWAACVDEAEDALRAMVQSQTIGMRFPYRINGKDNAGAELSEPDPDNAD